jgi:hemerythrin superfamily protein
MDALELLKEDHRKVGDLFAQFNATEDEKKHQLLFEQIKGELETHTHIEETVLYPAFEKYGELKAMVLEAYEEHKQIKTLISEVTALSEGSERFDSKLKVMGENVVHHVKEEESEMFAAVKKFLDPKQLEQLGQELEAAKKQFVTPSRKHATVG